MTLRGDLPQRAWKGSIAVVEKVKAMSGKLDKLALHAETLEAAEHAAKDHADREKDLRRQPIPGANPIC